MSYSNRTIPAEVSNREDLDFIASVFDDDTGQGVDMAGLGWTFQFEIRPTQLRNINDGYQPWYSGQGTPDALAPLIVAVLGGGANQGTLTIVDVGYLGIFIPELLMKSLTAPKTYVMSLTCSDITAGGRSTRQIFIARLPVVYGGVTI